MVCQLKHRLDAYQLLSLVPYLLAPFPEQFDVSCFFPSAGLWVGLAVLALVDLLAMVATGFRLVGYGTAWIAAVSAGAWGLGYLYTTARPDARVAALAFGAAYLIPFTIAAAILS